MTTPPDSRLAPPGAGLPQIELFFARRLFRGRLRSGSRESFNAEFERMRREIAGLVANCPETLRGERVLIRRPRGLEDSSRNWSVWMTLDHLRICNLAFARIIGELSLERTPEGRADTADVKPDPLAGEAVELGHDEACRVLVEAVEKAPELRTSTTFPHPWFGPLDAFGWHALAAMHMGLHRTQLGRILAGLPDAPAPGD